QQGLPRHALVEVQIAGHKPDPGLDGGRLAPDVQAVDPSLARRGLEHSHEQADGRGLAGAVGTEEAEDLALLHAEIQRDHAVSTPVRAGEAASLDGGGHALALTAAVPLLDHSHLLVELCDYLLSWSKRRLGCSGGLGIATPVVTPHPSSHRRGSPKPGCPGTRNPVHRRRHLTALRSEATALAQGAGPSRTGWRPGWARSWASGRPGGGRGLAPAGWQARTPP